MIQPREPFFKPEDFESAASEFVSANGIAERANRLVEPLLEQRESMFEQIEGLCNSCRELTKENERLRAALDEAVKIAKEAGQNPELEREVRKIVEQNEALKAEIEQAPLVNCECWNWDQVHETGWYRGKGTKSSTHKARLVRIEEIKK